MYRNSVNNHCPFSLRSGGYFLSTILLGAYGNNYISYFLNYVGKDP